MAPKDLAVDGGGVDGVDGWRDEFVRLTTGIDEAPVEDRTFRRAALAAGCAVIVLFALVSTHAGGDTFTSLATNLSQLIAPALAAMTCWRAARNAQAKSVARGWYLVSLAAVSWLAGQLFWTGYENVLGLEVPSPSLADAYFLLAVPFAIAGLYAFPDHHGSTRTRVRNVIDGVILAAGILFISWVLVLSDVVEQGGSALQQAITIAYPVADIALLTIVFLLAARPTSVARSAMLLLGAGFAAFAVGDTSFVGSSLDAEPVTTNSDTMWVAGYLLIALAGLRAVGLPEVHDERRARAAGRVALLLPVVPTTGVVATATYQRIVTEGAAIDNVEFGVALVLFASMIVRQALVLYENQSLTKSLEASLRKVEHQAMHDPLTGLPNRSLLFDRIDMARERMSRTAEPLGVIFCDLDDFKPINDRLGHDAGDRVLAIVANRLQRSLRSSDTAARFGGDEFVLLCERLRDPDDIHVVLDRVRRSLREPLLLDGVTLEITASIGVVVTNDATYKGAELVEASDGLMYAAKEAGGDTARLADWNLRLLAEAAAMLDHTRAEAQPSR